MNILNNSYCPPPPLPPPPRSPPWSLNEVEACYDGLCSPDKQHYKQRWLRFSGSEHAAARLNYKALASLLAQPVITPPFELEVESRFSVIRGTRMI